MNSMDLKEEVIGRLGVWPTLVDISIPFSVFHLHTHGSEPHTLENGKCGINDGYYDDGESSLNIIHGI